jgi:hypothetical protein
VNSTTATAPTLRATFSLRQLGLWLVVSVAGGLAVAWAAAAIESARAPLVIFSLVVGLAMGLVLTGAARWLNIGHAATLVWGTILAGAIALVGQHFLAYRSYARQLEAASADYLLAAQAFDDEQLDKRPIPPDGFVPFLRWKAARGVYVGRHSVRGAGVWGLWTLDAILVIAAACGVIGYIARQPYCSRCRSWYRTVRRGSLEDTALQSVAAEAGIEPPRSRPADYRLFACSAGCGPTGFEMRWTTRPAASVTRWLDASQRRRIEARLDEQAAAGAE